MPRVSPRGAALMVACMPVTTRVAAQAIEGFALNLLLTTEALQPPEIRALNLQSHVQTTILQYDLGDIVRLGGDRQHTDGRNRTLRPHGLVLRSGTLADTIYWADAGAGAILGMRFDQSGIRIMQRGLSQPEHLVLDAAETALAAGGPLLYWGDSVTNRIQRCRIVGDEGNAGTCSGLTDVHTGTNMIAGLALVGGRLIWADGVDQRILSGALDASGRMVAASIRVLVPFVEIPVALGSADAAGNTLLFLDQATPTTLSRVSLDGNASLVVKYGLSRPHALAFTAQGYTFITDSGRRRVFTFPTGEEVPMLVTVFEGSGSFEPRGAALRDDARVRLPVAEYGIPRVSSAGCARRGASHAGAAGGLVGVAMACLAIRSGSRR